MQPLHGKKSTAPPEVDVVEHPAEEVTPVVQLVPPGRLLHLPVVLFRVHRHRIGDRGLLGQAATGQGWCTGFARSGVGLVTSSRPRTRNGTRGLANGCARGTTKRGPEVIRWDGASQDQTKNIHTERGDKRWTVQGRGHQAGRRTHKTR